jgi:hypothetical protein
MGMGVKNECVRVCPVSFVLAVGGRCKPAQQGRGRVQYRVQSTCPLTREREGAEPWPSAEASISRAAFRTQATAGHSHRSFRYVMINNAFLLR